MSKIVEAARTLIGTPFIHQGRGKSGLDCVGVAVATLALCGYEIDDVKGYPKTPIGVLQGVIEGQTGVTKVKDPEPGDFLLMRFKQEPQHVAVYAGKTIIHSYEVVGKVVEHNFSEEWRQRVVAVYRVKI